MEDTLMFTGLYATAMLTGLYATGILIGFFLIPFIATPKYYDEEEGIKLDEKYDLLLLSFKFMEQVEEAPDSALTEEELAGLKDKILHYDIPYLKNKVIMFYDREKDAFCYYANSSIIYKYINVAARRYVLDFGCKQIYKEMTPSMKKEEKTVTFGQFVPKVGKTTLEKEMNKFLYLGNLHDYKPVLVEHNKISFSEYMKQITSEVTSDSSSNLETQWTKTD
jgi:hypothetical protein